MCLGIPGRLVDRWEGAGGAVMGTVSFSGICKEVCLDCLPEVGVGDHVIVHLGYAVSRLEEDEALELIQLLGDVEASAGADMPV